MAVTGDNEARQRPAAPGLFEGCRHRRRALAGADDESPPFRRRRRETWQKGFRLRRRHAGVKGAPQQGAGEVLTVAGGPASWRLHLPIADFRRFSVWV